MSGNQKKEFTEKEKLERITGKPQQKQEEHSFAWELIQNARQDSKRWFIVAMTILFLWFATIGIFVAYLSLYDFTSVTEEYQADSNDGGNANIINGDGKIINGESKTKENNNK